MRVFGVIGKSLSHSFSGNYFTEKFKSEGISDHRYDLFELESIESISELRGNPEISGLNVTIPYKEEIIPLLDEIDPVAESIGAVNVVKTIDGKWVGYNSDAYGFLESIKPVFRSHHSRALILGTGGASKAVRYALDQLGVDWVLVSRNPKSAQEVSYGELDGGGFSHFKFIINTTPVGTYPDVESAPNLPYHRLTDQHLLVDLVYNPKVTRFMKNGMEYGASIMNGYDMLRFQAEKSWEIWNS